MPLLCVLSVFCSCAPLMDREGCCSVGMPPAGWCLLPQGNGRMLEATSVAQICGWGTHKGPKRYLFQRAEQLGGAVRDSHKTGYLGSIAAPLRLAPWKPHKQVWEPGLVCESQEAADRGATGATVSGLRVLPCGKPRACSCVASALCSDTPVRLVSYLCEGVYRVIH